MLDFVDGSYAVISQTLAGLNIIKLPRSPVSEVRCGPRGAAPLDRTFTPTFFAEASSVEAMLSR